MLNESPDGLADLLRSTLEQVEQYGSRLDHTESLCVMKMAIACVIAELDPEREREHQLNIAPQAESSNFDQP